MKSSTLRRLSTLAVVAGGSLGLMASPASAVATLTPVVATPTTAPYSVSGTCTPVVGTTTNLNQITYTIEGTASAATTKVGVAPISTGVTCKVRKRAYPYEVVGSFGLALPGAAAAAVGQITVQINDNVKLCWSGSAHYTDNYTRTESEKCS